MGVHSGGPNVTGPFVRMIDWWLCWGKQHRHAELRESQAANVMSMQVRMNMNIRDFMKNEAQNTQTFKRSLAASISVKPEDITVTDVKEGS